MHHPGGLPELHLMPLSDIGWHAFDRGCLCRPTEDAEAGEGLWHHNAYDGREAYETGARRAH